MVEDGSRRAVRHRRRGDVAVPRVRFKHVQQVAVVVTWVSRVPVLLVALGRFLGGPQ
ncbi:hypothetical protein FHS42_001164 [Streptomyces zagrosensis]|uniref:Uncharacterized protein n=1 Tax=Streptomyces zagrosensis TaxID=1042984 RepID=A0A7W9Q6N5_9ACTN|nr:hypothetical protein [Streptomyces zagrosensis]